MRGAGGQDSTLALMGSLFLTLGAFVAALSALTRPDAAPPPLSPEAQVLEPFVRVGLGNPRDGNSVSLQYALYEPSSAGITEEGARAFAMAAAILPQLKPGQTLQLTLRADAPEDVQALRLQALAVLMADMPPAWRAVIDPAARRPSLAIVRGG